MESHLLKIKMLLNLSKSPEPHEAAAAAAMALKLIEKFNVTEDQLAEINGSDKPIYTDDNLLIEASFPEDWIKTLALVVAKKYDCYAIEEENVVSTGEKSYKYYVYGDDTDIAISKELFKFTYDALCKLLEDHCSLRGKLYRDSFAEGAVNGIRVNIEYEDFSTNVPIKIKQENSNPDVKPDAIASADKGPSKPPAIEDRVEVNDKEKPLDIMAYFLGQSYAKNIHIGQVSNETHSL